MEQTDNDKHNDKLFFESGQFTTEDPLVSFLYELMRDYVPAHVVENITRNSPKEKTKLTNGWLGRYAVNLAERLK